jgi:hypothetical protein
MTDLSKKLQVKPGSKWLLFNPPANYLPLIEPLPDGVQISYDAAGEYNGIQLFIKNSTELTDSLQVIKPLLKTNTIFWVTYPKKSSGIQTDLEMMTSWDELTSLGLRVVTSISVDDTWTGLRFKPIEHTKLSEGRNEAVRNNEYGEYIDVDNKQVTLPSVIKETLQQTPQALAFYQQLSYSNKKEYVLWILTAKQEKTRDERLVKMVEKLLEGKKNPAEK